MPITIATGACLRRWLKFSCGERGGFTKRIPSDPDLPKVAFALDSSVIALCLNLFPWGYYARTRKAAVKLHLRLSLQGNLPAWAAITEADFPDMKMLDNIAVIPGAYDVMDRGYLDFVRLFQRHQAGGFFVVRGKVPCQIPGDGFPDRSIRARACAAIKPSN